MSWKNGAKIQVCCDKANGHLVFDARMNIERKARWLKDRQRTPEPECSTFAVVASRKNVRIGLTCYALNDIPVHACDT